MARIINRSWTQGDQAETAPDGHFAQQQPLADMQVAKWVKMQPLRVLKIFMRAIREFPIILTRHFCRKQLIDRPTLEKHVAADN